MTITHTLVLNQMCITRNIQNREYRSAALTVRLSLTVRTSHNDTMRETRGEVFLTTISHHIHASCTHTHTWAEVNGRGTHPLLRWLVADLPPQWRHDGPSLPVPSAAHKGRCIRHISRSPSMHNSLAGIDQFCAPAKAPAHTFSSARLQPQTTSSCVSGSRSHHDLALSCSMYVF